MFTPRTNVIRIVHDDVVSGAATWWKSIFLVPLWLAILLPAFGAVCRACNAEVIGFAMVFVLSILYFIRDLLRKKISLDSETVNFGYGVMPYDIMERAFIEKNYFRVPHCLVVQAKDGSSMKFFISRLKADDLELLLETLQKRATSLKVHSDVDALLKYKKAKTRTIDYRESVVSIDYHPHSEWSGLPRYFLSVLFSWSRSVGPTGAFILAAPIWMIFVSFLFGLIRDYSNYEENRALYDTLVHIIATIQQIQAEFITSASGFLWQLAEHPLTLIMAIIGLAFAILGIAKSSLCANRLTLDKSELSLDRWSYLYSYNLAGIDWAMVRRVFHTEIDGKPAVCLETPQTKHRVTILLEGIEIKDRSRLLEAIKRFCPDCEITPEVLDMLETRKRTSYTQLWLQSLSSAPERSNLEPLKQSDLLDGGRYEVVRRLGVGGQGTAYLGIDHHQESAPLVALKETIIPVFAEAQVRHQTLERFSAEAQLLEQLHSDNIVKLIDYFVDDHRAYLVLEHIEGATLRQLVSDEGALPPERVERLAEQMFAILEILHEKQIIHRDFTPDNLILTPEGTLKLIDFNVAQKLTDGSTDTIVGKHAYVPPEQFRGKPTNQSDIYALGATLFYILTGKDPEPLSQSHLPDNLPERLKTLVEESTALTLEKRIRSIAQARSILSAEDNIIQLPTSEKLHDRISRKVQIQQ